MRIKTLIPNIVILSVIAFLLLLTAYTVRGGFLVYNLIALLLLAAGCLGSLWLRPVYKVRFTFLLLAIGFSLLLGELLLEVYIYQSSKQHKSIMDSVVDLRDRGMDVYPATTGRHFVIGNLSWDSRGILPLGGISNKFTVLCHHEVTGEPVTYQSDRYGFNNPQDYIQKDNIEIVLIGDSYIHGMCVDPDRNISHLLRQTYPQTLNFGVTGAGPIMELGILTEYVRDLKPSKVLWFYFEGNDLDDLRFEKNVKALADYLDPENTQNLTSRQKIIDEVISGSVSTNKQSNFTSRFSFYRLITLQELRRPIYNLFEVCPTNTAVESLDDMSHILSQARSMVSSWGGELYLVYLPTWERYSGDTTNCGGKRFLAAAQLYDEVVSISEEAMIPVIDIKQEIDAHPDPLSFWPLRKNGHLNDRGNSLVAQSVLRYIYEP